MIKVKDLLPEIYYNNSRDFQVLGRVYEIIFNYIKCNTDIINNLPDTSVDSSLLDLLCTTLGFKRSHSYNNTELKTLVSIFSLLIKNKGNLDSLKLVLSTLLNIENVNQTVVIRENPNDKYNIIIYISNKVKDTALLQDVLEYIIPAGVTYNIFLQELITTQKDTDIINNTELSQSYTGSTIYTSLVRESDQLDTDNVHIVTEGTDLPDKSLADIFDVNKYSRYTEVEGYLDTDDINTINLPEADNNNEEAS